MTEQEARQLYVTTARDWLGANEGGDRHKKIIDTYNSFVPLPRGYKMTYTAPWCAAYASVPGIQLGWTDILPVECSCSRLIELYKAHPYSRWEERDDYVPQIGDGVMYNWPDGANYATTDNTGAPDHVGIVIAVNSGNFDVIEGNYSNAVKIRNVKVNGQYIRGFLLPAFRMKAKDEDNLETEQELFNKMFNKAMDAYLRERAAQPPSWWSGEAREWAEGAGLIVGDESGNKEYKMFSTLEAVTQLAYNIVKKYEI